VFGLVAFDPMVSRLIEALAALPALVLQAIRAARACKRAWALAEVEIVAELTAPRCVLAATWLATPMRPDRLPCGVTSRHSGVPRKVVADWGWRV
jgi:hypothetical protein